jgi:TolB protein
MYVRQSRCGPTRPRRTSEPGSRLRRRRRKAPTVAAAVAGLPLASLGVELPTAEASERSSRDRIAFIEVGEDFVDFNIGDVTSDGSVRRQLTAVPAFDIGPDYSPDGRRIAFTSGRSAPAGSENDPAFSETYVMNADGSQVRRVTFNDNLRDSGPAWSPDGSQLVLARAPSDPESAADLWIVNLRRGTERQLTDLPDTNESVPDWSPSSGRIVFHGDVLEPGNYDLYSVRPDGTGLRRLTRNPAFDGDAKFSPDGQWIVFGSDRTGNGEIFMMRPDGSGLRQVTFHPAFDAQPGFSGEGRSITFISERDGGTDVFRMRTDGAHTVNITNTPSIFEFEPDGQPPVRH